MTTIITFIHVLVCLFLIVIVLLQHGKGADIGATFGGGGNTVFGTEGPVPLLNKVTTMAAIIFMMTSIGLAYFSAHRGSGSVMESVSAPISAPAPVEAPLESGPVKVPMPSEEAGQADQAPATFPGQEK
ncbi:MAG: preprotein translocase subunit SecG [Proteobacteria bacterium]|nr:preprotein translocase subunit SecG [Pseudomonadota bacterium]MBU1736966.1 preprotein translocase subunit SecG [Pseudomonadota bacterium]